MMSFYKFIVILFLGILCDGNVFDFIMDRSLIMQWHPDEILNCIHFIIGTTKRPSFVTVKFRSGFAGISRCTWTRGVSFIQIVWGLLVERKKKKEIEKMFLVRSLSVCLSPSISLSPSVCLSVAPPSLPSPSSSSLSLSLSLSSLSLSLSLSLFLSLSLTPSLCPSLIAISYVIDHYDYDQPLFKLFYEMCHNAQIHTQFSLSWSIIAVLHHASYCQWEVYAKSLFFFFLRICNHSSVQARIRVSHKDWNRILLHQRIKKCNSCRRNLDGERFHLYSGCWWCEISPV